jgi:hypothetical protein
MMFTLPTHRMHCQQTPLLLLNRAINLSQTPRHHLHHHWVYGPAFHLGFTTARSDQSWGPTFSEVPLLIHLCLTIVHRFVLDLLLSGQKTVDHNTLVHVAGHTSYLDSAGKSHLFLKTPHSDSAACISRFLSVALPVTHRNLSFLVVAEILPQPYEFPSASACLRS